MEPSKPEPMPVNDANGFEVVPQIIEEIKAYPLFFGRGKLLIKWLTERSDFGFKKYGARLTYPNGRNWHKDLCDELADAVNYARGALEADQISAQTYFLLIDLTDAVLNGQEVKR